MRYPDYERRVSAFRRRREKSCWGTMQPLSYLEIASRSRPVRDCSFFFSSRRRHTRLQGDWSSDVCSSHLFAFKTARAMLANGFYPDTISSDVHTLCIEGPAFDQVTTLSKFLCMGMPLNDVIAASTVNAAMALRRPELGSLKPGSVGDATLISIKQGQFDYVDVVGEHLIGDRKIVSEGVVIGGRWWHPKETPKFKQIAGSAHGKSI